MKGLKLLFILTLYLCQAEGQAQNWLNRPLDIGHIREVVNTYHMISADGEKVGSMIFGFWMEDGKLMARDTSQFDDGSVYETAEFTLDLGKLWLLSDKTSIKTPNMQADIDLSFNNKRVKGQVDVKRANGNDNTIPIDQNYSYDIVRSEIYMLLHTLSLSKGDTIKMNVLVPNSLTISEAQLYLEGQETIKTAMGVYDCDVYWLKTDGKMPENKIWISKESPRTIIKFNVPAASLDIELVSQRALKGKFR